MNHTVLIMSIIHIGSHSVEIKLSHLNCVEAGKCVYIDCSVVTFSKCDFRLLGHTAAKEEEKKSFFIWSRSTRTVKCSKRVFHVCKLTACLPQMKINQTVKKNQRFSWFIYRKVIFIGFTFVKCFVSGLRRMYCVFSPIDHFTWND